MFSGIESDQFEISILQVDIPKVVTTAEATHEECTVEAKE